MSVNCFQDEPNARDELKINLTYKVVYGFSSIFYII